MAAHHLVLHQEVHQVQAALHQEAAHLQVHQQVHKNVKKDEFIIRAGEPCDTVYIILKGDVVGVDYQKLGK